MDAITGKIIGDVHITVCETPDKKHFFYLQADNEKVLPVLDTLENTLNNYRLT